jgi:hypothetical protein
MSLLIVHLLAAAFALVVSCCGESATRAVIARYCADVLRLAVAWRDGVA